MQLIQLSALALHQTAKVTELRGGGALTQRIRNLGVTEGAEITPLFHSPFRDPTAYRVKGCVIALRKADCRQILVMPLPCDRQRSCL